MQAFLEYTVKGLVQHPDDVSVTPVEREGTTVYELRLHPQDVGKVIGRQGMTINAIRSLLLAAICGYLSWVLIEKWIQRWVHRTASGRVETAVTAAPSQAGAVL